MRLDLERSTTTRWREPATGDQLDSFIASADALELVSVGTAALIGFELALREPDIIGRLSWSDWRPTALRVVILRHGKTAEEYEQPLETPPWSCCIPSWRPGSRHRPRAMDRCIIMQDGRRRRRVQSFTPSTACGHLARRIREHAGLPDTVSFASFRKGGMTEMGEAGLTDQQIVGPSGHKTRQMVSVYSKADRPAAHRRGCATLGAPPGGRQERTGGLCRNSLSERPSRGTSANPS